MIAEKVKDKRSSVITLVADGHVYHLKLWSSEMKVSVFLIF